MSLFKKVKKDSSVQATDNDVLGRTVLETNVYPINITKAFVFSAKSGAQGLRVEGKLSTGSPFETTFYFTTKDGANYTVGSDKKKRIMQGYVQFRSLIAIALGVDIDDEDQAEELNYTESNVKLGKETIKAKVIDDLTDVDVLMAIQRVRKNRQVKNDSGEYVSTAEVSFDNEVVKIFSAEKDTYGCTLSELEAEAEATYMAAWLEKHQGKDKDNYKEVKEGPAKASGGTGRTLSSRTPNRTPARPSRDEEGNDVDQDEVEADEAEADEPAQEEKPVRKGFRRQ